MSNQVLADEFSEQPWWWSQAAPADQGETDHPDSADAASS
jgi:hypothetical protein